MAGFAANTTRGQHLNGSYLLVTESGTLGLRLDGRHEEFQLPTGASAGAPAAFIVEAQGTIHGSCELLPVGPYVRFRWFASEASPAADDGSKTGSR
jgi:hypothetical protein